jgi:hypothetical protein
LRNNIRKKIPFIIASKKKIKYLGVFDYLPNDVNDLYKENYKPLNNEI